MSEQSSEQHIAHRFFRVQFQSIGGGWSTVARRRYNSKSLRSAQRFAEEFARRYARPTRVLLVRQQSTELARIDAGSTRPSPQQSGERAIAALADAARELGYAIVLGDELANDEPRGGQIAVELHWWRDGEPSAALPAHACGCLEWQADGSLPFFYVRSLELSDALNAALARARGREGAQ